MSKMFVHFNGTIAAFKEAGHESKYTNHIVFIAGEKGEGAAVYTHGKYFGNVKDALAALEGRMGLAESAIEALKYFSQIKVGDKVASASGKDGIITFAANDPQEISIDVNAHGLTFGLTDEFKTTVSTAASQAAAAATKTEVSEAIQALKNADTGLGNRITALETAVGGEGNSLAARMSAAESDIDALEGLMTGDETGSVNARIEAAKGVAAADATSKANAAEAAAKSYADGLKTTIDTAYAQADATNLQAAKEHADGAAAAVQGNLDIEIAARQAVDGIAGNTYIANTSANYIQEATSLNDADVKLDAQVKVNADAIAAEKARMDAFLADATISDAAVDTLKEIQAYITTDGAAAQEMLAAIDTAQKAADKAQGEVDDLEEVVASNKTTIDTYTVNGQAISGNPVLDSADIKREGKEQTVEATIAALETAIGEGGSVDNQIKTAIEDLDADKTSTNGTYVNVQVVEVDGKITAVNVTENDIASAQGLANVVTSLSETGTVGSKIKDNADAIKVIEDDYLTSTDKAELIAMWAWEELPPVEG